MPSIKSPWATAFDEFAASIQETAIIAAPYITRQPVERLAGKLSARRRSVRLDVLTNLQADSLIDGSLDIGALAWLCQRIPGTTVRHLRYLHAKAYVADGHTAIVTSSNLTSGGLLRNRELGVAITEPDEVKDIADDLREYGNLGVLVPPDALSELYGMTQQAQRSKATVDKAVPNDVRAEYDAIRNSMNERLVELRTTGEAFVTDPKAAITAQFADAIGYVLRRQGPMRTIDTYPLVQILKPELCADDTDIILNGMNFGRNWKRAMRNAQTHLKNRGVIVHEGGRNGLWRLT